MAGRSLCANRGKVATHVTPIATARLSLRGGAEALPTMYRGHGDRMGNGGCGCEADRGSDGDGGRDANLR